MVPVSINIYCHTTRKVWKKSSVYSPLEGKLQFSVTFGRNRLETICHGILTLQVNLFPLPHSLPASELDWEKRMLQAIWNEVRCNEIHDPSSMHCLYCRKGKKRSTHTHPYAWLKHIIHKEKIHDDVPSHLGQPQEKRHIQQWSVSLGENSKILPSHQSNNLSSLLIGWT